MAQQKAVIERGVVLTEFEVRAILEGRQTQMRRIVKPQPSAFLPSENHHATKRTAAYFDAYCNKAHTPKNPRGMSDRWCWWTPDDRQGPDWIRCPFGAPGHHLWVRETWQYFDPDTDSPIPIPRERMDAGKRAPWQGVQGDRPIYWTTAYRADGELVHPTDGACNWRPSVQMPRWASRITLAVESVRVERLHDITEEDARAEGVALDGRPIYLGKGHGRARVGTLIPTTYRVAFERLWREINGAESWDANPWVWVVGFRRVTP